MIALTGTTIERKTTISRMKLSPSTKAKTIGVYCVPHLEEVDVVGRHPGDQNLGRRSSTLSIGGTISSRSTLDRVECRLSRPAPPSAAPRAAPPVCPRSLVTGAGPNSGCRPPSVAAASRVCSWSIPAWTAGSSSGPSITISTGEIETGRELGRQHRCTPPSTRGRPAATIARRDPASSRE